MNANVRQGAGLMNPETGSWLELDIYLPSLNLAFEYQVNQIIASFQCALTDDFLNRISIITKVWVGHIPH